MVVLLFLIAAILVTVILTLTLPIVQGPADFWKPLLICFGAYVAVVLLYLGFAAIVSIPLDKNKPLKKQSKILKILCEMAASQVCTYMSIRPHVSGVELLPTEGTFLMVCNHLSGYDPLVMIRLLRRFNIFFIEKPSIMRLPLIGIGTYGAGCLAIDRENNREALKTILQAADYLKRGICSICIYPEGTRSKTGQLGEFHPGSFKIAQKAGVSVVVACISGTEKVNGNILRRFTDVDLDILEVIPAERVAQMRTVDLAEESRSRILQHQQDRTEEKGQIKE